MIEKPCEDAYQWLAFTALGSSYFTPKMSDDYEEVPVSLESDLPY